MVLRRIVARLLARSSRSWPKLLLAGLLLAALPVAAAVRGFGQDPSQVGANASEMVVERLEPTPPNKINLVLKEKSGARRLVLAVGETEASSIIQDVNLGFRTEQPVTAYAMTRSIVDGIGGRVQRVVVNNVNETSFFAKVVVTTDSREIAVDAAPSDAIALALRAKAPIYADVTVLDRAGIVSGR